MQRQEEMNSSEEEKFEINKKCLKNAIAEKC